MALSGREADCSRLACKQHHHESSVDADISSVQNKASILCGHKLIKAMNTLSQTNLRFVITLLNVA